MNGEIIDVYKTIAEVSEAIYTEKRSKFISFAIPVENQYEIKQHLERLQKEYYDARHICYAYMLGKDRKDFRANDNGEPSGTAGKPILGQINSNELSDILIVVIRYFGGIKLGTSGLIVAYREVAAEAIRNATIIDRIVKSEIEMTFEYPFLNGVMKVIKDEDVDIVTQTYDMDCYMKISVRDSLKEQVENKLLKVETLSIINNDTE
ncbi:MAG: YigZ family protein [Bacteroides sp.]|nr:YigZ family protein [Bacteroides sp.]